MKVQTKEVQGVLDSDETQENTFIGTVPFITALIEYISLLTNDLSNRSEKRLRAIY